MIIVGLDVSTTCTGYTIFLIRDGKTSVVDAGYIRLNKYDSSDLYGKANAILEQVLDFGPYDNGCMQHIFIAEPLKRFARGMSSAKTINLLWRFNGMLCMAIHERTGIKPTLIDESKARRQFDIKKQFKGDNIKLRAYEFTKCDIKNYDYNIEWEFKKDGLAPKPHFLDLSDSYVIAKYGLGELINEISENRALNTLPGGCI